MSTAYDDLLNDDEGATPDAIPIGWEEHGAFSMLVRSGIVAVVWHHPPHGVLRTGPKMGNILGDGTVAELKARAESLLRSNATVWDRLLDDDPEPPPPRRASGTPVETREPRQPARRTGRVLDILRLGEDE